MSLEWASCNGGKNSEELIRNARMSFGLLCFGISLFRKQAPPPPPCLLRGTLAYIFCGVLIVDAICKVLGEKMCLRTNISCIPPENIVLRNLL